MVPHRPYSPIGRGSGLKIRAVSVRVRLGARLSGKTSVEAVDRRLRCPKNVHLKTCRHRARVVGRARQLDRKVGYLYNARDPPFDRGERNLTRGRSAQSGRAPPQDYWGAPIFWSAQRLPVEPTRSRARWQPWARAPRLEPNHIHGEKPFQPIP